MRTEINLARPVPVKKNRRLIFLISLGIFTVIFVFSFGVILINALLNGQYALLSREEQRLSEDINKLSQKKIKYLTLQERLSGINTVLAKRTNLNEDLKKVISLFPPNMTVERIDANETGVTISVGSENLADINAVLESNLPKLTSQKDSNIKTVQMVSFEQDTDTGLYVATLNIEYKL